jgi:excinuclease UvrABC nuclease subunit
MRKKTVRYNNEGIDKLPNDKPVLYRIMTSSGSPNYVGSAQKGNVRERIADHLGEIPGSKVQIERFQSIKEAERKETNVIARIKPRFNIKGK